MSQNDNDTSTIDREETNKNYLEPNASSKPSYLFAFDFDHTVVDDNSDVVITNLVQKPVPERVEKLFDGTNWTDYMNGVFSFLHDERVTVQQVREFSRGLKPTKGMLPLLTHLLNLKLSPTFEDANISILVISDANDLFISEFLNARVLNSNTTPSPFDLITNKFNPPPTPSSPFSLTPFEHQSSCSRCPRNLCKGSALESYMSRNGPFTAVFYTGDGQNDVCPALRLRQHDFVFPRKDHGMHKLLLKTNNLGISAKVVVWEDGDSIQAFINEYLNAVHRTTLDHSLLIN